jgi:hypothetical protein
MAENPQQQLDDHYGDVGFRLVDSAEEEGSGMTGKEARAFLRGLRPVVRGAGQSLKAAAKAVRTGS